MIDGRLEVYNGDPERYITFITPETCHALDKSLDFRREHGEEKKEFSIISR
jgi:hypothetical protein